MAHRFRNALHLTAVFGALTLVSSFVLDPAEAAAQTRTATEAIAADGFVPVPGGKPASEEVNASLLVLLAYAAFALAFVGYLFHLARSQSRIARDIQELGQRIRGGSST